MDVDKKAKRILHSTYWEAGGWKRMPSTSPEDFEYAKAHGLMFDPVNMSHDQCVEEVQSLVPGVGARKAAKAFLSSLSTRRLDWRSGFASYVLAAEMKTHVFTPKVSGNLTSTQGCESGATLHCKECNPFYGSPEQYVDENINVLNFERFKWGGVRHGQLIYAWLDLRCLAREDIPEPTEKDLDIFRSLLATIDAIDPQAYAGTLEKELASQVPSAKGDRRKLLEVLGCAGILRAKESRHDHRSGDWVYVAEWRGVDRYERAEVERWFGEWISV